MRREISILICMVVFLVGLGVVSGQEAWPYEDLCSKSECKSYCDEHPHECLSYTLKHPELMPPEKVNVALKILDLIEKRKTPGECDSLGACITYCASGEHSEDCNQFSKNNDFNIPEGIEKAPCQGKECNIYCNKNKANLEKCIDFAKKNFGISIKSSKAASLKESENEKLLTEFDKTGIPKPQLSAPSINKKSLTPVPVSKEGTEKTTVTVDESKGKAVDEIKKESLKTAEQYKTLIGKAIDEQEGKGIIQKIVDWFKGLV